MPNTERLVLFLYILLRDKMTVGELNLLATNCQEHEPGSPGYEFEDSLLEQIARRAATQILDVPVLRKP